MNALLPGPHANGVASLKVPPKDPAALSVREQLFVQAYVCGPEGVRGVGAAAAEAAGYRSAHRQALAVRASKLLVRPRVRAAVQAYRDRLAISPDRVLQELAAIAFADLGEFMTWDAEGVAVRPSAALPAHARAAIAELIQIPGATGPAVRVRLHDKVGALRLLAKIMGLGERRDRDDVKAFLDQMNLDGLSDDDLATLERLVRKASGRPAVARNDVAVDGTASSNGNLP